MQEIARKHMAAHTVWKGWGQRTNGKASPVAQVRARKIFKVMSDKDSHGEMPLRRALLLLGGRQTFLDDAVLHRAAFFSWRPCWSKKV